MSDRYRIPKTRVPVEVRAVGGSAEKAFVFLGEGPNGQESVPEFLNGSSRFLVAEDETGGVAFHRIDGIARVTIADSEAIAAHGGPGVPTELANEVALRVEFDDGSFLDGVAVYALCESRARIQDFLNAPDAFFPLFHNQTVSYVNKARVARVSPRESRRA